MTDLPDKPESSPEVLPPSLHPETGLDDLAALLAEQVAAGHAAAARCFAIGADEEDFGDKARNEALKIATRLVDSCAKAAQAINRIKGKGFHYRVTVDRVDVEAEKKARRARKKTLVSNRDKKIRESINKKWSAVFGVELKTDEEREKEEKAALLTTPNVQPNEDVTP
jgi:hypothetical protein